MPPIVPCTVHTLNICNIQSHRQYPHQTQCCSEVIRFWSKQGMSRICIRNQMSPVFLIKSLITLGVSVPKASIVGVAKAFHPSHYKLCIVPWEPLFLAIALGKWHLDMQGHPILTLYMYTHIIWPGNTKVLRFIVIMLLHSVIEKL